MTDLPSYRESHVGDQHGNYYDRSLSGKHDHATWEIFVKPKLMAALQTERAAGHTRYLDFACGTGRITEVGAQVFEDANGIDISPDMIQSAMAKAPNVNYTVADITRDPAALAGYFDCITAYRFFLNAEDELRHSVLSWLSAHSRPGAALIGNVHMNPCSFSGVATVAARKLLGKNVNALSRRDMARLLETHGFTVERWQGFRVMPTVSGRAILPLSIQVSMDRALISAGLQSLGAEQMFIARRM